LAAKRNKKFKFYLGCPNSAWLSRHKGIPFFVSRNQMPKKRFKRAVTPWALDSGGFTELQREGTWTLPPKEYVSLVNLYSEEVGSLEWAAPQDWMCEPVVIKGGRAGNQKFKGTGLSVREHQKRTVDNFMELEDKCSVPIIPVIQGYTLEEYMYCVYLYDVNGIDVTDYPVVGVGSICRRQATQEAGEILKTLHNHGVSIHGFGLKRHSLRKSVQHLVSADSMAWSFNARHSGKSCGKLSSRTGLPIKNCANCHHAAVEWYEQTKTETGF